MSFEVVQHDCNELGNVIDLHEGQTCSWCGQKAGLPPEFGELE